MPIQKVVVFPTPQEQTALLLKIFHLRLHSDTLSFVKTLALEAHQPLSPVIKLGIRHPRKKERKNEIHLN